MNTKRITVKYEGKRKSINLVIDECINEFEIIRQLQDPEFKADWKDAYLESHYQEQLNDKKNERTDRHTSLETFTYEDAKFFDSGQNIEDELMGEEFIRQSMSVLNQKQRQVIYHTILLGKTPAEYAREIGKDPSGIRKLQKRALEVLKDHFGKEF